MWRPSDLGNGYLVRTREVRWDRSAEVGLAGGVLAVPHLTRGPGLAVPPRACRWAVQEVHLTVEAVAHPEAVAGAGGALAVPRLARGLELAAPLRARSLWAEVRPGTPGGRPVEGRRMVGRPEVHLVRRGARSTHGTGVADRRRRRS